MSNLLEKHITKQVRDYLAARGWRPVRMHPVVTPGMFSAGEPGQPDYLFLHYRGRAALVLWIEFKGPKDRRRCVCRGGDKNLCAVCRQQAWHDRERLRGATVWVVSDIAEFIAEYERVYGWLHFGDAARGQLDLLADAGEKT